MDLRSIINTEGGDSTAQRQVTPITPAQAGPAQQSFREYNYPQPASSNKHSSQDYGPRGPEPYTSQAPYPSVSQGRPAAPPPLQPPSHNDLRSPASSSHYSAQSPYTRHTSSSSVSGQYPFPPNQTPQSPAQPSPYPTSLPHRESYPQTHPPPPPPQHHNSYGQPSPMPNTPPVGTTGVAHPYVQHQRSQSSHSTSTPTSAHSQQQYHHQYPLDSPVSASSFQHSQLHQHQRQPSQPRTSLGPPISNPRQTPGSFTQPTSPYQQRPPSSGMINQPYPNSQVSAAPPLRPQIPRQSSTPSMPGSHQSSVSEPTGRSQGVRERSVSVSPKTQLPNLPRGEMATNQSQQFENGHISMAKRKIDDREVSGPTPIPQLANGDQARLAAFTHSPQQSARKRVRYTEPPIWARSVTGLVKNTDALLTAKRSAQSQPPNGHHQIVAAAARLPSQIAQVDYRGDGPLGPWEPSITGIRPYEEVSKIVADWLFLTVVSRPDAGELASRGVEIEIEAKLGQLINKDTNERLWLPIRSECVLVDNGRVSFKSSMTEAQHKTLNDFLNHKVEETHPDNPNRTKPRIPIVYAHRRERDRFYELPPSVCATLPACIRSELNPRHTVKVRVTHDQKTGQLLAKIIKARVADLDLYNPRFPLDCRISVNLEMRYEGDVEALAASADPSRIPDRNKDRLCYTQSHYQIDLTQVTVADPSSRTEKEHELEIEVSTAAVREQGRRAQAGEPNQYGELIEGLIDNVRVLTRNVPDHSATLG